MGCVYLKDKEIKMLKEKIKKIMKTLKKPLPEKKKEICEYNVYNH